jgi:hypothetical protein
MSLKEHLQFLAMMVPTFLLLCAFAVTLAFPAKGPHDSLANANPAEESLRQMVAPLDTL